MAALALGLLSQAPQLLGAVGDIVHLTERLFGKGKGQDKKQAAMNLAGELLNTYKQVAPDIGLTGANADEVNTALSTLVDSVVAFYNAAGLFGRSQVAAPKPATPKF